MQKLHGWYFFELSATLPPTFENAFNKKHLGWWQILYLVADKKLLIIFGKRFKMLYLCGLKLKNITKF